MGIDPRVAATVALITNPCHGPLVRGTGGDENEDVERVRSTFAITGAGSGAGCMLFFPDFTAPNGAPGTPAAGVSLVGYTNNNPATGPTTYAGTSANVLATTGFFINPPASGLATSDTVSDMHVAAACLSVQYLGTRDGDQGEFCYIDNLPISQMIDSTGALPTIDQLFSMTEASQRLGLGKHEVLHRSKESQRHDQTDGHAFDVIVASPSVISQEAKDADVRCIGVAWRGGNVNALNLRFEFTQVVSARHRRWQNVLSPPPITAQPTLLSDAQRIADTVAPGWTTPPTASSAPAIKHHPFHPGYFQTPGRLVGHGGKIGGSSITSSLPGPGGLIRSAIKYGPDAYKYLRTAYDIYSSMAPVPRGIPFRGVPMIVD